MNVKCFCLSSRSGLSLSRRFDAPLEPAAVGRFVDPSVLAIRWVANARVFAVVRTEDESWES